MGGLVTRKQQPEETTRRNQPFKTILRQYEGRCDRLDDDRFLQDLERDSVDADVLDDELRSLDSPESDTWRAKIHKCLDSNPLQIAMCILVLFDAGVVVGEILLDLHAMKIQSRETTMDLFLVTEYLRNNFNDELQGYNGSNVEYMLHKLNNNSHHLYPIDSNHGNCNGKTNNYSRAKSKEAELHDISRNKRDADNDENSSNSLRVDFEQRSEMEAGVISHKSSTDGGDQQTAINKKSLTFLLQSLLPVSKQRQGGSIFEINRSETTPTNLQDVTSVEVAAGKILRRNSVAIIITGADERQLTENKRFLLPTTLAQPSVTADTRRLRSRRSKRTSDILLVHRTRRHDIGVTADTGDDGDVLERRGGNIEAGKVEGGKQRRGGDIAREDEGQENDNKTLEGSERHMDYKQFSEAERLLKIAHVLHYISIAILGIFVIQVLLKLLAMGVLFFRRKMEIFDAIIVVSSFVMDLVFLDGVTDTASEQTVIIIMIFLIWRILRIVNGLMVTSKQRHEFRIKLQRRARRRMDKKLEILHEDVELAEKEMLALKILCTNKGVTEEELISCKPRRKACGQKMSTSSGLSSIASLSLGLMKCHAMPSLAVVALQRSGRTSLTGYQSARSSVTSLQGHAEPLQSVRAFKRRPNGGGGVGAGGEGAENGHCISSSMPQRLDSLSEAAVVTHHPLET